MPAKSSMPKRVADDKGPFNMRQPKAADYANVGRDGGRRGPAKHNQRTPRKG